MTDTKQAAHAPVGFLEAEHIPEYFAKQDIVEGLSAVHPVLLVRQMANEILRLRAERDALVEALEQCAGELESEFTGTGGKDLSGGLVPKVRALLSRLERP